MNTSRKFWTAPTASRSSIELAVSPIGSGVRRDPWMSWHGLWADRHRGGTHGPTMAMYISIDVDGHRYLMGRKTQITLTDRQHAFLRDESNRTGLPMTALVRRPVDGARRSSLRLRFR